MAKNKNLSDLDSGQVFKRVVDSDHDAVRVVQAFNTEMFIELNEADGDSVQACARTRVIKESDGAVRCDDLREICKYGNDGQVEISPDGESFVNFDMSNLQVKKICALKIRVKNCMVVGRS